MSHALIHAFERNGQLVEHLRAGVEFEDFKIAILKALSQTGAHEADRDSREPIPSDHGGVQFQDNADSDGTNRSDIQIAGTADTMNFTPPRSSTPQGEVTTSSLQQVMEGRRKRLEADKAAKDVAEKEKKKAVAQARRAAASASPGYPVSNQSLYAKEHRKRKQEATQERERILRVIENDKAERKQKEAQRRALAEAEAEAAKASADEKATESNSQRNKPEWGATPNPQQCYLQVRLFDGTTLRGRFDPSQTVGCAVRKWIAEHRTDGDAPFTLKRILTPLPNKTITISEEEECLESLNLLPSATLVMVPIQSYTGAYINGPGLVGKGVSVGYNAACAGGNMLKGALRTVLGLGHAGATTQEHIAQERESDHSSHMKYRATAVGEDSNFRTLRTQEDKHTDHQLYNGNQLNFEPRTDEDDG
ncbi:MAG: hypothetical protein Q9208_000701 [Pyrenodesmia sp. 3 TL-2023]